MIFRIDRYFLFYRSSLKQICLKQIEMEDYKSFKFEWRDMSILYYVIKFLKFDLHVAEV